MVSAVVFSDKSFGDTRVLKRGQRPGHSGRKKSRPQSGQVF